MNKVCFTDCDGVHSNGVYYFDDWRNDTRARVFHPRDGHGVQLLKEAGWDVVMLSGEADENIFHRCSKLKIHYYVGKDKLANAQKFLESRGYTPEKTITAYIGDDVFDVPLLEYVHFPGCPKDALVELLSYELRLRRGWDFIPYVTASEGGRGAFRDFADHLLSIDAEIVPWIEKRRPSDKQQS